MDIDIVMTRLAMRHPFLASCAMRLKWVADKSVPTLGTDGQSVYYNPDWMNTEGTEVQLFCVAHECMHVLLMHMAFYKRWVDSGVGPDAKPYDHRRMNRAMDFIINGALVKDGFKTPSTIKVCHSSKYDLSTDLIKLYIELENDGKEDGDSMDTHMPADMPPVMTPSEVVSAAMSHKALKGKSSHISTNMVLKVTPNAESPWASLRELVTRGGAPDTTTWNRPNRKLITRGIIAPSAVSVASPPLAVVVDISGSVNALIPEFMNQVASIVLDSRCTKLLIAFVDDKVRMVKEYDDMAVFMDECQAMTVPDGGGTDMRVGLKFCEKENYQRCVCITDGHTPYPTDSPMHVIWAMTTDVKPPFGDVVRI